MTVPFEPKELAETADNSQGENTYMGYLRLFFSLLSFIILFYLILGIVSRIVAIYLPDELEGSLVNLSIMEKLKPKEGDPLYSSFKKTEGILTEMVEKSPDLRKLPYYLFMVKSEHPNAYAIPGGGVGVTTTFLKKIENESALAMVIGHELAHHHHRHVLKALSDALITQLFVTLVFENTISSIGDLTLHLQQLHYSREHEWEADKFGLQLVHKTLGINEHTLDFYKEMLLLDESVLENSWGELFSTHPIMEKRYKSLQDQVKSLKRSN